MTDADAAISHTCRRQAVSMHVQALIERLEQENVDVSPLLPFVDVSVPLDNITEALSSVREHAMVYVFLPMTSFLCV